MPKVNMQRLAEIAIISLLYFIIIAGFLVLPPDARFEIAKATLGYG